LPEELVGTNPYEIFHPDDIPFIRKRHEQILVSLEPVTFSYRIRRKDGAYIWYETTTIPFREGESVTELLCISRDISARRKIESDLRESLNWRRTILDSAMDCQMPEMDGYEAAETIRREKLGARPNVPIIAFTAAAMKGDEQRCFAAGMDDYVSKPIRNAFLAEKIEKWLN
jgi:CheY-like chemotaxis protein